MAAVERARQVARSHQPPMLPAEEPLCARPCLACGAPWPCPAYQHGTAAYERATRLHEVVPDLPDRFSDRVPRDEWTSLNELTQVGEWHEALDLLLACLHHTNAEVTDDERQLLGALMDVMGIPAVLLPGSNPPFEQVLADLLVRFDGRPPPHYQAAVRARIDAGEWVNSLELLLQHLREVGTPVTQDERESLRTLALAMHLPASLTNGLYSGDPR